MSEQILLQPIQAADPNKAIECLEKARLAHEKYLISFQNKDLQESWLVLTNVIYKVNMLLLDVLGIEVPNKM